MNANPATNGYTTPPASPPPLAPPKLPPRKTPVLQAPPGNVPPSIAYYDALCMLLDSLPDPLPAGAAGAGPVQPGTQADGDTLLGVLFPQTF